MNFRKNLGIFRKRSFLVFLFIVLQVICSLSYADVTSNSGNVDFDIDDNASIEMRLDSTGLAIGSGITPSANLEVGGNTLVTGTIAIGGISSGSSNFMLSGSLQQSVGIFASSGNIDRDSMVLADSSAGDLTLALPPVESCEGRIYHIKKVSTSNTVIISGSGNTIDSLESVYLASGDLPSIKLISSGGNWHLLSISPTGVYYPWTPALLTLSGWWDATDASTIGLRVTDRIKFWYDKSGEDTTMWQGTNSWNPNTNGLAETINGLNTITFDGSNDRMDDLANPSFDDPISIYAVGRTDNSSGNSTILYGGDSEEYRFFFGAKDGNFATYFGDGLSWHDVDANTPNQDITAGPAVMGVVNSGGTATPYFNGVAQGTKTGTVPSMTGLRIGRSITGGLWDGPIGEILIAPSALSTDDRQKLEGYLAHKWGLEGDLDSGHPYKSAAPQINLP